MSSSDELSTLRTEFRAHVLAGEAALSCDPPDVAGADRHTDATDAQVSDWVGRGLAGPVLLPLLGAEHEAAVRCAAATYLLRRGHAAEAQPVLEELADDDDIGLVASDAEDALDEWRDRADD